MKWNFIVLRAPALIAYSLVSLALFDMRRSKRLLVRATADTDDKFFRSKSVKCEESTISAELTKPLKSSEPSHCLASVTNHNITCCLTTQDRIIRFGKIPPQIAKHIEIIEQIRVKADAPVDTMGCHMLADKNAEPKVYRFQILVALMLSSQTKDEVVSAAMERLKACGCSIDWVLGVSREELAKLICPVGFYKRKAEYLQRTAAILRERHADDIPDTIEALTALPGVGPKMGHLVLQIAFDKSVGIGVDTHVHRIANRLGWVHTRTPNETETRLRQILPRNEWRSINKLLVGFGQQTCRPVNPRCADCLNREFCPSATSASLSIPNKKKE